MNGKMCAQHSTPSRLSQYARNQIDRAGKLTDLANSDCAQMYEHAENSFRPDRRGRPWNRHRLAVIEMIKKLAPAPIYESVIRYVKSHNMHKAARPLRIERITSISSTISLDGTQEKHISPNLRQNPAYSALIIYRRFIFHTYNSESRIDISSLYIARYFTT
jgi:hypothetical protein